jgi:hypothetical protein
MVHAILTYNAADSVAEILIFSDIFPSPTDVCIIINIFQSWKPV